MCRMAENIKKSNIFVDTIQKCDIIIKNAMTEKK